MEAGILAFAALCWIGYWVSKKYKVHPRVLVGAVSAVGILTAATINAFHSSDSKLIENAPTTTMSTPMNQGVIDRDRCITRGIKHFKDMGSWPRLEGSGEESEVVVKRRCNETPTAF